MSQKIDTKVFIAIISVTMLSFVGTLSETALNVAFPLLIDRFHITSSDVQWLTSAYLLVVAVFVPVSPAIIRKVNTKKLFLIVATIFLIGTIICAAAPTFQILLAGRIVQAISTGISLPLIFNLVLELVPKEKRGTMMGFVGMTIILAPAIGPTFGGLITDLLDWHWIFIIEVPIILIITIIGFMTIPSISTNDKTKVDILSIILSAVAFSFIVAGLSFSGQLSYKSPVVIFLLVVGIISLLAFAKRQTRIKNPLINPNPFRYRAFNIGLALTGIVMFLELGLSFLAPNIAANHLHVDTTTAGLIMLPAPLLNAIMAPIAGRIFDKYGAKILVIIGAAISLGGLILFMMSLPYMSVISMTLSYMSVLLGVALMFIPSETHALNSIPHKYNADGTAIINTLQQVTGAMGTALIANALIDTTPDNAIFGAQASFMILIAAATLALFLALNLVIQAKKSTR